MTTMRKIKRALTLIVLTITLLRAIIGLVEFVRESRQIEG